MSLKLETDIITPVDAVRDLGFFLDSQLTMKSRRFLPLVFHLRRLRQIRRRLGPAVTSQLVLAHVTWKIDYCNSVLAGLLQFTLAPMQRVQNSAIRLVFDHLRFMSA